MGIGLLRQYYPKPEEPKEVPSITVEDNELACQFCGKELKSKAGRIAHEKSCSHNPEKVGE